MKWTISEIKERGRATFMASYWKSVLVAFVLALLTGGFSFNFSFPGNTSFNTYFGSRSNSQSSDTFDFDDDDDDYDDDDYDDAGDDDGFRYDFDDLDDLANFDFGYSRDFQTMEDLMDELAHSPDLGPILAVLCSLLLLTLIISIVLSTFLFMPLIVGCRKFFKDAGEKRIYELGNIVFAFNSNYMNIVKVSFMMGLRIFLWSLLFIIPGIIKAYEYSMIPYILGDEPDIPMDEAFRRSKEMMKGNKWHAFLLDLSFLGWILLGFITCGILLIFYVRPYLEAASAELYLTLKGAPRDFSAYENARQFNNQSGYGRPPYGQPPYGQNQYGQNPYGQRPPYGQPPYGQPPYGAPQSPAGQPPYGAPQTPAGQPPYSGQAYNAPAQPLTKEEPSPAEPPKQHDNIPSDNTSYSDGEYRELKADDDAPGFEKNDAAGFTDKKDIPPFGDERNRRSGKDLPFNTPY